MDNLENIKDSCVESSLQVKNGVKVLRPHFVIFNDDEGFHNKLEQLINAAKQGLPMKFESRKEALLVQNLLGGEVFTSI